MHRFRHLATVLCLASLWLQTMAPALALSMPRHAPDPFVVICHAPSAHAPSADKADHREAPLPHAPACDHCLLCHAVAGGLPPTGLPVFTLFDYPVSSPLRWVAAETIVATADFSRSAQPRGPPTLV